MGRSRDGINQAARDLERGFYEWSAFSTQQAAEKAAWAVFQPMGAVAWGHSVADLLEELNRHRPVPPDLVEKALLLDKAYIPSRYSDAHPGGARFKRFTEGRPDRWSRHRRPSLGFGQGLLSPMDAG